MSDEPKDNPDAADAAGRQDEPQPSADQPAPGGDSGRGDVPAGADGIEDAWQEDLEPTDQAEGRGGQEAYDSAYDDQSYEEDYDYGEGGAEGHEDYEYEQGPYDQQADQDDDQEEEEEEDEEEEDEEEDKGQKKMTLVEHLEELRTRLIRALIGLVVGMALSLGFGKYIFRIVNEPFYQVVGREKLVAINMPSPFMMYMKVCLYVGIIIASPWIFYQLWMFVSAGLYAHERRYVKLAVPFCTGLFILGATFFLKLISLPLLRFFYLFNRDIMGVAPMVTLENHVTFMTNMMLVFGLCFQTPVAVLLLGKMGLVTVKTLNRYRKHVIVIILIIAAFCTSPSPLDQIALAIPMWMLYELGVVLTYFLVEKKRRAEELAEKQAEA
jgi:sec-independent protein translocase protein TatC